MSDTRASYTPPPITARQRFRYFFDNTMAAGPAAMIIGLAVLSVLIVLLAALVIALLRPPGSEALHFGEAMWQQMLRTLDPGTMGGDEGWGYRVVSLLVTIGGIFVVATLIGVLASGIEGRLDELRKGRSLVLESGHTLILGWSQTISRIVAELVEANANVRHARIVIVADRDKAEMDDEIRRTVELTKNIKVICRSGSPLDPADVAIGNPQTSRSIVILTHEEDDADAQVVKTILAIVNAPDRREEPYSIIAELRDPEHFEVARMVGGDEVVLIPTHSMIAHITAQTCRQSGLSVVYTELLDFAGDEIYFATLPDLAGTTFGEAMLRLNSSTLIGMERNGQVLLGPPMSTVLAADDKVIAIAADDDRVVLDGAGEAVVDTDRVSTTTQSTLAAERTLIVNWNERGDAIVRDLDESVAAGSALTVLAEQGDVDATLERLRGAMTSQELRFVHGDPTDRRTLDGLLVDGNYDHVIILSSDAATARDADTNALLTLLHVRDISKRHNLQPTVVTELFDRRNRELARVTEADDFIVSEEVISLLIAQVSENPTLAVVLSDIFEVGGAQVSVRPARDYVQLGAPVSFGTVVHAARAAEEVAIGYRKASLATRSDVDYGVAVNPPKDSVIEFDPDDRVIVLANPETVAS